MKHLVPQPMRLQGEGLLAAERSQSLVAVLKVLEQGARSNKITQLGRQSFYQPLKSGIQFVVYHKIVPKCVQIIQAPPEASSWF